MTHTNFYQWRPGNSGLEDRKSVVRSVSTIPAVQVLSAAESAGGNIKVVRFVVDNKFKDGYIHGPTGKALRDFTILSELYQVLILSSNNDQEEGSLSTLTPILKRF